MSILVTGGARSGKSALAERLALRTTGRAIYIATAEALDADMAARIAVHRARRGPEWRDVAAPLNLLATLHETDGGDPRLVDCLTIWLSNLIHAGADWRLEGSRLAEALAGQKSPVVFVTNEVGAGIVPENRLAREFRDAAGWLNQTMGEVCEGVWMSVAGCPLRLKPGDDPF